MLGFRLRARDCCLVMDVVEAFSLVSVGNSRTILTKNQDVYNPFLCVCFGVFVHLNFRTKEI